MTIKENIENNIEYNIDEKIKKDIDKTKKFKSFYLLNKLLKFNNINYCNSINNLNNNKRNDIINFNDSIKIKDLKYIFINNENINLLNNINNYKFLKNNNTNKYFYTYIKNNTNNNLYNTNNNLYHKNNKYYNSNNIYQINNNLNDNGYYFYNLSIQYLEFCKNYKIKLSIKKIINIINNNLYINLTNINYKFINFDYKYETCNYILKNLTAILKNDDIFIINRNNIIIYIIKKFFKKCKLNIKKLKLKKKYSHYSNTVKQFKFILEFINNNILKINNVNKNISKYNKLLNNEIIDYIIKNISNKYFIQLRKKNDSNNSSKDTDNLKLHEYYYFDNPTYSNNKKLKIKRQLYFNKSILYLLLTEFDISIKQCKNILNKNIDVLMYFNELDIISNCINNNLILAISNLNNKYLNLILKNNNYNENIVNMIIKYNKNINFNDELIINIIKQNYYKIDTIINIQNYLQSNKKNLNITHIHRIIKYNFDTLNFDNIIRIIENLNLYKNNIEYIKKKAIDKNIMNIYQKIIYLENSSFI